MAAVVAERVGDLTLRLARALVEECEHRVVLRCEPRRLECVSERSLIIKPSRLSRKALLRSNSWGGPAGNGWSFVRHGCR